MTSELWLQLYAIQHQACSLTLLQNAEPHCWLAVCMLCVVILADCVCGVLQHEAGAGPDRGELTPHPGQ